MIRKLKILKSKHETNSNNQNYPLSFFLSPMGRGRVRGEIKNVCFGNKMIHR
jgi:hypothetical protein